MTHLLYSGIITIALGWVIGFNSSISPCRANAMDGETEKTTLNIRDLQGQWRIEYLSSGDEKPRRIDDILGLKHTLAITEQSTIIVKIENLTILEGKIAYDIKKTPIWIDIKFTKSDFSDKPLEVPATKGLLKVENGDLVIHLGWDARPTDFQPKDGLTFMWVKCKKIK